MRDLVLLIVVQLLYVPMLTLRTICMVKNLKVMTAMFGFIESLIYVFGLAIVLSGEQSIVEMLVYALGFAMGLVLGIYIEQKIAIGYTNMNVNINHSNTQLVDDLRKEGFGVTLYVGEGLNGPRHQLEILTKRKREKELIRMIVAYEPHAFITAYEPKQFRGGYLTEVMKKRMKRRPRIDGQEDATNVFARFFEEVASEAKSLVHAWKRK